MKPMYPLILPWLAGKTGTPDHTAHRLWRKALRDATAECAPQICLTRASRPQP